MKVIRRLLPATLAGVLLLAHPLAAQTLRLTADPGARKLSPGPFPTLSRGQTLKVVIAGVPQPDPDWSFTFGGVRLTPPSVGSAEIAYTLGLTATTLGQVQVQPTGRVKLEFTDASPTSQAFSLSGPIELSLSSSPPPPPDSAQECGTVTDSLRLPTTYDRGHNRVLLEFDSVGLPLRSVPTDIDDNDAISIVLDLPCGQQRNYTVEVEGKIAEGDISVLSAGALATLSKIQKAGGVPVAAGLPGTALGRFYMGTFGPYQPPSIKITIKGPNNLKREHTIRILRNYHAALRLGVGQSATPFNAFDVRPRASDGTKVITNTGDPNGEPRYFVSMVFYSWQFWNPSRFWNGRDLSETPTFLDRINPYIGLGLRDPGREYVAGATLELARGLDVVWGVHVARTRQLTNGYKEGDPFTGAKADIPLRDDWKIRGNFFGVSADLGVAVNVLQAVLGQ